MKTNNFLSAHALIALSVVSCNHSPEKGLALASPITVSVTPKATEPKSTTASMPVADAATILSRTQVPILCYHRLRDYKPTESASTRTYIVPVPAFQAQIKMLADSGYHAITPNDYYEYLAFG